MPQFTIGEDNRVTVVGPYGNLDLPEMTSCSISVNTPILSEQDLDGNTNSRTVYKGVSGTFTVTRSTPEIDNLVAAMYQSWLAKTPIPNGQIVHVISELDGSETTKQITDVAFAVKDLGTFKPNAKVPQTLTFMGNGYYAV